ncbi:MAG: ORF6N domain-containing protein [Bacteroidales bacterium]|nr:ORF6N domain-containing protein [Bacteroidales bacterium]
MEILENKTSIEERIFSIRGKQVILDRDLARLYGVEVAQMNRQVKRNMERFPDDFLFQLIREEWDALKCHFGISNSRGGDRSLPYAFTEQGVSMLAGLLRSPIAIEANIRIIRAFIALRKAVKDNELLLHRIERIEYRQSNSEFRIEELFNKIKENNDTTPVQGIFFDGQVYDAYVFVAGLVRKAAKRIVLIDNYIDETVLTLLDKRASGVEAVIYTGRISQQLQLDIDKHNAQYPPINVRTFNKAHDRFLIIDDEVYLVGASIKDLGKKWFGFTLMENTDAEELIGRI